jgi:NAD(P)-dependent dehydrogenase (short-subunit alcohol dehydrogenase family)
VCHPAAARAWPCEDQGSAGLPARRRPGEARGMKVLIIGGGSGMGLALAEQLMSEGADVIVAGRSELRLKEAAAGLPGLRTAQVDIVDEDRVRRLLDEAGELDHLVVTAADAVGAYAPVRQFPADRARAVFDTKVLGPLLVVKHAAVTGSITFTSGIAAYRPGPGGSVIATANAALEGLARALALELAPVRVNVISPGWVDTPIWTTLAGDAKDERLAAMAARLPVGRVGSPGDLAAAFVALIRNGFVTATVLHVDGGHRLV